MEMVDAAGLSFCWLFCSAAAATAAAVAATMAAAAVDAKNPIVLA